MLAKHRIEIWNPPTIGTGFTEQTKSESLFREVWAIVEPKSGLEKYSNGQLESTVAAHIDIRYITELSNTATAAKYYIKFGTRRYNILAVLNMDALVTGQSRMIFEGKKYQRLICTENEIT